MVCDPQDGSMAPFCFSTIWYSARWGGNLPLWTRGTGTEAFGITYRVRFYVFLKRHIKKSPALSHFDYKIEEMYCLFANNAVCSCCEIKDEIIAWQMRFVDRAVISLHCCREEINISRIWAKLTYCTSSVSAGPEKAEIFGMQLM